MILEHEPGGSEDAHSGAATRHFRLLFAALMLASVFICGYGAQLGYFYDIDEPKYCVAGYEMALTGDFARPMYNGQPRMEKPPLVYWLVVPFARAALALGGPEAFTPLVARLPGVLAALFIVAGTVLMGRRLYGPLTGLMAGLMLQASVLFKFVTVILKVDVFFTASVTWVSYFLLCRLLGDRGNKNLAWLCLATAAGTLSKGPFAYLPLAAYAAALVLLRPENGPEVDPGPGFLARAWAALWSEKVCFAACLIVGCGAFFGWIAWACQNGGVNYLAGLLAEFSVNTTVGAGLDLAERVGKTGFYGDTIATVFYPWCAFLPGAFLYFLATFRRQRPASLYIAALLFIYVIVFTLLFRLKAHRYFLPAAPFLALMASHWLLSAPRDKRWSFWFDMCSIWLACLTAFFLVRFWRGAYLPVNLYYTVPGTDLYAHPTPLLIGVILLATALLLASLRQARHPVQHILILSTAFALAMPFYALALPRALATPQPGHAAILARNLTEKLRPLARPDTLLVHSRELQLLFPDLVFFWKDVLVGKPAYSLALDPTAGDLLTLLQDPDQAEALLAKDRPGSEVLPIHDFLASHQFRRTLLLMTAGEYMGFTGKVDSLPLEMRPHLRVDRAEGMTVKWVLDQVYLVSLAEG